MWWLCVKGCISMVWIENGINTLCDDFHLVIKTTPIQIHTLEFMPFDSVQSESYEKIKEKTHAERGRAREEAKENICIIMTIVTSNIAKSINLPRQVLVHTYCTPPKIKVKVLQMPKKLIFTLFPVPKHTQHYNSFWLPEKLCISINCGLCVCVYILKWLFRLFKTWLIQYCLCVHLPLFVHQNRLLFHFLHKCNDIHAQWFDKNIHILPHFWMISHSLLNFHTTIHTMATNKYYTIRFKYECMQSQLKTISFSLESP